MVLYSKIEISLQMSNLFLIFDHKFAILQRFMVFLCTGGETVKKMLDKY